MSVLLSAADFWDETAPSMLDFALSGPGWGAAGLAVATVTLLLATVFEIGPRRRQRAAAASIFYVRVTVSKALSIELPSGVVARLEAGKETVLREDKFETADTLARSVAGAAERAAADCRYTLYRADGAALVPLREYPREVDAVGARGWVGERDGGRVDSREPEARWDEYARLGGFGDVEKEWQRVVDGLGGVRREVAADMEKGACRLCAGTGRHKCHRCMGASASGRLQCGICINGRVTCEYCDGSGRAV